jgi:DNA repair photolyase
VNDNDYLPLVSQHISWISVDSIMGCPADCCYCFLKPMSLTNQTPRVIEHDPRVVYRKLREYYYFNRSSFENAPRPWPAPIAIGNYTDMCMTSANRDHLLALLRVHEQLLPEVPVCIPTKAVLTRQFLELVSQIDVLVIFFVSISFLAPDFEKGAPTIEARLRNFRLLSEFPNLKSIHWWRPVTSLSVPHRAAVERQIDLLQQAGSITSVVIGLRYGERLVEEFRNSRHPLHRYFESHAKPSSDLIFEERIRQEILNCAAHRAYPVFGGTACAISYLLGKHCYNAGFRKSYLEQGCATSNCPAVQRERCLRFAQAFRRPSRALLDEVARYLNLPVDHVTYSPEDEAVLVRGTLLQEQQNYLTQALSFPVMGDLLVQNLAWTATRMTAPFTV